MTVANDRHLIFFSPTGTSKTVGTTIASTLWEDEYTTVDLTQPQNEDEAPLAVKGSAIIVMPVYAGRIPSLAVERLQRIQGAGQSPAVIVVVYGNRAYEDALLELRNVAIDAGFLPLAAAACIGEHSYSRPGREIAAGRPDEQDLNKITTFAQQLETLLESIAALPPIDVPGNAVYREGVKPVSFHPQVTGEPCTLCGACADVCPSGIITVDSSQSEPLWENGCILCCSCIKACPIHTLELIDERMVQMANILHKNFQERQEPEFFLP